jgi:TFIIF-interacting CTD phosphatase-like protein
MINKKQETYFVRKRPFLHEFLEKMSHFFELVVFTASLKEYADKVIDYIDPKGYIKRRFYRDVKSLLVESS